MSAIRKGASSEEVALWRREQKLQRCKHWNGVLGQKPCALGVNLIKRVGPRVQHGWARRIPCVANEAPAFVCEQKVVPTDEEIEASEREMKESAAHTLVVMAAIPKGAAGSSGTVPCPECGGPVYWQRSSYNGHLSAACAAGCVRFME